MKPTRNHKVHTTNPKFGGDSAFPFPKQRYNLPNYRYRHRHLGGNKFQKYYDNDDHPGTRSINRKQQVYVNGVYKHMIANRLLIYPGKLTPDVDVPFFNSKIL